MDNFTFGSLFSGIGGIDLGLERAGFQIAWQCENDPFCTKVLTKHWPNVARYGDIHSLDTDLLARVDLIAGGPPCQPHSLAGKRKAGADERNLWPEFARVVRELKPRWILVENVVGILSSEGGHFFGNVLRDLAQVGYDATWFVLSAADMGAPHLRERVFIVAHSSSTRSQEWQDPMWTYQELDSSDPCNVAYSQSNAGQLQSGQRENVRDQSSINGTERFDVAYPQGNPTGRNRVGDETSFTGSACSGKNGSTWTLESGVGRDADGFSAELDRYRWPARPGTPQQDWEPPRVITERVPNHSNRLKALGNAVVPQVAEHIGRAIRACEVQSG